jgi:hypothetical protein
MTTIVALTSNNWSSTTVDDPWPGGTKPGVGDTVQTGAFVIEIDEDITVALLEATSSGIFTVAAIAGDGVRTITASVLNSGTASGGLLISNPTGSVVQNGNVTGGSAYNAHGIANTGTMGTVTGDVTGGSGDSACGVANTGTMGAVTGDVTGGSSTITHGIVNVGTMGGVTGNVTGGSAFSGGYGIDNTGTMGTVTGNVTGGSEFECVGIKSLNYSPEIVGNVTGGTGRYANGIWLQWND